MRETTIYIRTKRILPLDVSVFLGGGGTFKYPICYAVEDFFAAVCGDAFGGVGHVADVDVVIEDVGYF
jgi:hypothetical protein